MYMYIHVHVPVYTHVHVADESLTSQKHKALCIIIKLGGVPDKLCVPWCLACLATPRQVFFPTIILSCSPFSLLNGV